MMNRFYQQKIMQNRCALSFEDRMERVKNNFVKCNLVERQLFHCWIDIKTEHSEKNKTAMTFVQVYIVRHKNLRRGNQNKAVQTLVSRSNLSQNNVFVFWRKCDWILMSYPCILLHSFIQDQGQKLQVYPLTDDTNLHGMKTRERHIISKVCSWRKECI